MAHEVVTISSVGWDPDKQGIGGSPALGDCFSSYLWVPQFRPAVNPGSNGPWWFIFRLCAYSVAPGERVRVKALLQYLTIAQQLAIGADDAAYRYVDEREVVSAGFRLSDAAVSWHLRVVKSATDTMNPQSLAPLVHPSLSRILTGTDSAMLIDQYDPRLGLYTGLNGGEVPGVGLGDLGTFTTLMFGQRLHYLDDDGLIVDGPATLMFLAAVLQSDPLTRPFLPVAQQPTDKGGQRPEERFVEAWGDPPTNNVRYRHIGATMVLERTASPRPR